MLSFKRQQGKLTVIKLNDNYVNQITKKENSQRLLRVLLINLKFTFSKES
jgi:hypothetical protein